MVDGTIYSSWYEWGKSVICTLVLISGELAATCYWFLIPFDKSLLLLF